MVDIGPQDVARRELLECLARDGFEVEVLSDTILGPDLETDPSVWLAGQGRSFQIDPLVLPSSHLMGEWPYPPSLIRTSVNGVRVVLLRGPSTRINRGANADDRVLACVFERLVERFQPGILMTWGFDRIAPEVMKKWCGKALALTHDATGHALSWSVLKAAVDEAIEDVQTPRSPQTGAVPTVLFPSHGGATSTSAPRAGAVAIPCRRTYSRPAPKILRRGEPTRYHVRGGLSWPGAGRLELPTAESAAGANRYRPLEGVGESDARPVFVLAAGQCGGPKLMRRLLSPLCQLSGPSFGTQRAIESMAIQLQDLRGRRPVLVGFGGISNSEVGRQKPTHIGPSIVDLLPAHRAYAERLFSVPSPRTGSEQWGFQANRLSANHAAYLRLIFPGARILFLVRDPYVTWQWRLFEQTQELARRPRTTGTSSPSALKFARQWRRLVTGFLRNKDRVGALLVRYEDLAEGSWHDVENYLGIQLSTDGRTDHHPYGPPASPPERALDDHNVLFAELGALAESLGYCTPGANIDRTPAVRVQPASAPSCGLSERWMPGKIYTQAHER
jgi:hypothetical protein